MTCMCFHDRKFTNLMVDSGLDFNVVSWGVYQNEWMIPITFEEEDNEG